MLDVNNIFFDLDGTLVDSLPGIQHSAECAAAAVMPECVVPDLRRFVGPPIRAVLAAALGSAAWGSESALERAFRSHYDQDGWKRSVAFPGAVTLLSALKCRGINCFVVTNKPLLPATQILAYLGLMPFLTGLVSRDSRSPPFGHKAEALAWLLHKHQIVANRAIMVGDSDDDASAADACGIGFVAAGYGYGARDYGAFATATRQGIQTPEAGGTRRKPLATLTALKDLSKILGMRAALALADKSSL